MTAPSSHESASPQETEALGAALAASLRTGDVVLLYGEMGTGKTTFVRGALGALGHIGPVTSPTYTIARRYATPRGTVTHLDLHRLTDLDDEDPGLLDDHTGDDVIAFVEWPQIVDAGVDADPQITGRVAARVHLEHVAGGGDAARRRVRIVP